MPEHIDNVNLVAYAVGMIEDEPLLVGIEEHLLICDQCRDVVTLTDRITESIRRKQSS